jgi:hypothetical protein
MNTHEVSKLALYFVAGLLGFCLASFAFFSMRGSVLAAGIMLLPILLLGLGLYGGLKAEGLL